MDPETRQLLLEEKTWTYNKKTLQDMVAEKKQNDTYAAWKQQTLTELLEKSRTYAEYEQLLLTAVENMRYASVAWLLGPQMLAIPLPDLIFWLLKHQVSKDAFEKLSNWVEDAGILRFANIEKVSAEIQKQISTPDEDKVRNRLAQIKRQQKELIDDLDYIAEQEQKALTFSGKLQEVLLRRVAGQRSNIESQALALQNEERNLQRSLQEILVAAQKDEAHQEVKRREEKERAQVPYCVQSLDVFDPGSDLIVDDTGEDSTVISIAVKENNLLARHCYIREQLRLYYENRVPIYEWIGMEDEYTPILGNPVYQLPIGNIFITQRGFENLMNSKRTNFVLKLSKVKQWLGSENHTVSALWNQHFDVYDVWPITTLNDTKR